MYVRLAPISSAPPRMKKAMSGGRTSLLLRFYMRTPLVCSGESLRSHGQILQRCIRDFLVWMR